MTMGILQALGWSIHPRARTPERKPNSHAPNMKKLHLLTAALMVAASSRFYAADKDGGGSSSESSSSESSTSSSKGLDPSDPNAVQGGQRKEAERVTKESQEEAAGPTVEPEDTAGEPCFDLESQREVEIFDQSDVVFVREGSATQLSAYPAHEAKTRYSKITNRKSTFKDSKTVTNLELENGTKVTIDGVKTIVTPSEGPANTDGPSLNVHGPGGVNL